MARCRITNPRKLKKIASLIGRDDIAHVFYRGGQWDSDSGHWFNVLLKDKSEIWIDSKLTKFGPIKQ